jgi:hypothetical protein
MPGARTDERTVRGLLVTGSGLNVIPGRHLVGADPGHLMTAGQICRLGHQSLPRPPPLRTPVAALPQMPQVQQRERGLRAPGAGALEPADVRDDPHCPAAERKVGELTLLAGVSPEDSAARRRRPVSRSTWSQQRSGPSHAQFATCGNAAGFGSRLSRKCPTTSGRHLPPAASTCLRRPPNADSP